MRERTVESRFCSLVEQTGGIHRKAEWIGRRGCPDRWCGWPRHKTSYWVELKRPETPDAAGHQRREHERMRSCGAIVYLLPTVERVEDFIALASGLDIEQVRRL